MAIAAAGIVILSRAPVVLAEEGRESGTAGAFCKQGPRPVLKNLD